MIPLLAKDAIKIKCGFTTACMTGNYECAYAIGLLSAAAGLPKEEMLSDIIALKEKVMSQLGDYKPANDAMKRLIEMLDEYEPSSRFDEQMSELYYVGFDDKTL